MIRTRHFKSTCLLETSRRNSRRLIGFIIILLTTLRHKAASGSEAPDSAGIIKRIQGCRLKILVVDDDPNFRKALCFNLRKQYTATVDAAGSGAEGIDAAQGGKVYDLIMLDLRMDDKNGIETYRELVGLVNAGCRFALMSAWPDSQEWDDASKLDVVLLQKPFPEEHLMELLNKCAGDHCREKESFDC